MSGTRWIKTKRESIYRQLVEGLEDPPEQSLDQDVYPFEYAYELFTAGLVVGYLENEQFDSEYEGDGDYHEWIRFSQFAESNSDHLACVDLYEKLIQLETKAQQLAVEGDESGQQESSTEQSHDADEESGGSNDQVSWDDIVDYADKGVGVLLAEWNETENFDLEQYFSEVEHEVEDRIEIIEDLLTERPTTGDDGGVSI